MEDILTDIVSYFQPKDMLAARVISKKMNDFVCEMTYKYANLQQPYALLYYYLTKKYVRPKIDMRKMPDNEFDKFIFATYYDIKKSFVAVDITPLRYKMVSFYETNMSGESYIFVDKGVLYLSKNFNDLDGYLLTRHEKKLFDIISLTPDTILCEYFDNYFDICAIYLFMNSNKPSLGMFENMRAQLYQNNMFNLVVKVDDFISKRFPKKSEYMRIKLS